MVVLHKAFFVKKYNYSLWCSFLSQVSSGISPSIIFLIPVESTFVYGSKTASKTAVEMYFSAWEIILTIVHFNSNKVEIFVGGKVSKGICTWRRLATQNSVTVPFFSWLLNLWRPNKK